MLHFSTLKENLGDTHHFPQVRVVVAVLDLVLQCHPSCLHIRRLRWLPAQHDVIVSAGQTDIQQHPVQVHWRIRLH